MSTMRRAVRPAIALLLVAALGTAAWAECLSGDLTPDEQECCLTIGHDCGAPGMDMACCSMEVQNEDRAQFAVVKNDPAPLVPVSGPLALLPAPHVRIRADQVASFEGKHLKIARQPAYRLLSVLLI